MAIHEHSQHTLHKTKRQSRSWIKPKLALTERTETVRMRCFVAGSKDLKTIMNALRVNCFEYRRKLYVSLSFWHLQTASSCFSHCQDKSATRETHSKSNVTLFPWRRLRNRPANSYGVFRVTLLPSAYLHAKGHVINVCVD